MGRKIVLYRVLLILMAAEQNWMILSQLSTCFSAQEVLPVDK